MPDSLGSKALGLDGPCLAIREGRLTLEGADLGAIANQFGTPCYATSERQIRASYRRLRDAFAQLYPATRLLYANKANNSFAVRHILTQEEQVVIVHAQYADVGRKSSMFLAIVIMLSQGQHLFHLQPSH
jgi:hypothetical protein